MRCAVICVMVAVVTFIHDVMNSNSAKGLGKGNSFKGWVKNIH